MKEKRTELLVGVFLLIGILVLGGLILKFGNFDERFKDTYPLTITFEDGGGLVKGTDVRLGGVKIGRVAENPEVNLDNYGGAIVQLEIFETFQIPSGSRISIGSNGLLGDTLVQIQAPKERDGTFIEAGAIVKGEPSSGLGALASSAENLSQKGQDVLEDIRGALGDLGSAIGKLDQNILREENLERFDTAMSELTVALEALNSKVLTEENTTNLRATLANLKTASAKLDVAAEKVGPLLDRGDAAIASLEPGLKKLFDAAASAGTAIDALNGGPGLLTALLRDEELRTEVEMFVSNLRRNGILRYKDNAADPRAEEEDPGDTSRSLWRKGPFRRN